MEYTDNTLLVRRWDGEVKDWSYTFTCWENDVAKLHANYGLRASLMECDASSVAKYYFIIFSISISIITKSSCYLATKPD